MRSVEMPALTIGGRTARVPVIQGGMAVRISMAPLAGAVARAGGIGVIAGSGLTPEELTAEIAAARGIAGPDGVIGVNIMVAIARFKGLVQASLDAGIDLVIAGAGFSREVFQWCREADTPLVIIVGSDRVAQLAQRFGAAAVIAESFEAGGHLGTEKSLTELMPEVLASVDIPVIAAGGIHDGHRIRELIEMGAAGVQMGSLFAATVESSASAEFKRMYVECTADDVMLVKSPVGLPGRALRNPLAMRLDRQDYPPIESCVACLKKCNREYCIIDKLIKAQQGDVDAGLVFAGESAVHVSEIPTVAQLIDRLQAEYASA